MASSIDFSEGSGILDSVSEGKVLYGGNRNLRIHVKRFILVETGTYNTQYHRSLTTAGVDADALEELSSRLHRSNNPKDEGMYDGIADSIIGLNAAPEHEIKIANGWGTRRLAFIMFLEFTRNGSTQPSQQIVTGWGEHDGQPSLTGGIDPDTKFTINNVIEVANTYGRDRYNRTFTVPQVRSIHHVVSDDSDRLVSEKTVRIQPKDVLSSIGTSLGEYEDDFEGSAQIFDLSVTNNKRPEKIDRRYSQRSRYIAGIVGEYADSLRSNRSLNNEKSISELCSAAARSADYANSHSDVLMSALANVRHVTGRRREFTMRELCKIDRDADRHTELHVRGETEIRRTYVEEEVLRNSNIRDDWADCRSTEPLSAATYTHQFMEIINQSLPSILADRVIDSVHFTATNLNTRNGRTVVTILSVASFPYIDLDVRGSAKELKRHLEDILFRDVTRNNEIGFDMECSFSLTGEGQSWLHIDGEDEVYGSNPTFTDSLKDLMVTDLKNGSEVANGMQGVIGAVFYGERGDVDSDISRLKDDVGADDFLGGSSIRL